MTSRRAHLLRGIYAIAEPERRPLEAYIDALLAGGIRLFQIRAKAGITAERVTVLSARVRAAGGLTIVNDDVWLAEFADGLHLGQEDLAAYDLRALRIALQTRIIGVSCGTPAEARALPPGLVDYVGVGPIFSTRSKGDAGLPIGISGTRAVVDATALPAAAIGGIDLASIPRVRESGAAMAAIISGLAAGDDARMVARQFVDAWAR